MGGRDRLTGTGDLPQPGARRLARGRDLRQPGGGSLAALEVLSAPRAQRPIQPDQSAAVGTHAVQAGPARRADDPVVMHPPRACRAGLDRLDLGQQRFLGEVAFIHLADLLLRPHDPIHEDRRWEEEWGGQDDEAGRQVRHQRVLGSELHVAKRPIGRGQPQHHEIDGDALARQLDVLVVDDVPERLTDLLENLVHTPGAKPPGVRGRALGSPRLIGRRGRRVGVRRSVAGRIRAARRLVRMVRDGAVGARPPRRGP